VWRLECREVANGGRSLFWAIVSQRLFHGDILIVEGARGDRAAQVGAAVMRLVG
jgi:hypothetical protein